MHFLFLTFLIIILLLKWKRSEISIINCQLDQIGRNAKEEIFKTNREEFSSMYCSSNTVRERVCRIKNLHLENRTKVFFLKIHPFLSLFLNINSNTDKFLDLSSVEDHSLYYWNYKAAYKSVPIDHRILEKSHLIKRFLPNNLMHILHDDWLGIKYLQKYERNESRAVIFFDDYPRLNMKLFDSLYGSLGKNLQYGEMGFKNGVTQFGDLIVGNSKALTWYQYGFKQMQGPVSNKGFNKEILEQVIGKDRGFVREDNKTIVLFSRTKNRKIVNEEELIAKLRSNLDYQVKKLSLETFLGKEFESLTKEIRKANVLIGIHGSLFALIPWLPDDTVVIEIFPYAIKPENYTPYRTLCSLLNIYYYAVENKDKNKTIEYPDRNRLLGGIAHLNQTQRAKILESSQVPPHRCCQDPEWLFRIYQDTIVDVDAILSIIKSVNFK